MTTVHQLIDRSAAKDRWGLLWIALTLAAAVVVLVAMSSLWPPSGDLPHAAPSGIQPQ